MASNCYGIQQLNGTVFGKSIKFHQWAHLFFPPDEKFHRTTIAFPVSYRPGYPGSTGLSWAECHPAKFLDELFRTGRFSIRLKVLKPKWNRLRVCLWRTDPSYHTLMDCYMVIFQPFGYITFLLMCRPPISFHAILRQSCWLFNQLSPFLIFVTFSSINSS